MRILMISLMIGSFVGATSYAEVIVPAASTWKYLHPEGTDPADEDKDFHTTFQKADFDDSKWKEGKDKKGPHGGFGYGDPEFDGVDFGQPENQDDRKSAYFRLKFKTTKDFELLKFKCQRDDAIIVYIDGKEVVRDNLEKGKKDAYDLFATSTVSGAGETTVNVFPFRLKLPKGDHVLAISLHNRPGGSSDLRVAEISLESATEEDFIDSQDEDDLF